MKITATNELAKQKRYAPAALGNGSLSILIGPEGDQRDCEYSGMKPGIRRAGNRYDNRKRELTPFGVFRFGGFGSSEKWTQSLDPKTGILATKAEYPDGSVIESETFCHFDRDIIAVHILRHPSGTFRFEYAWDAKRMIRTVPEPNRIHYGIDGLGRTSGDVFLTADVPATFSFQDGLYTLETAAAEFTVFLAFDTRADSSLEILRGDSIRKWTDYHNESLLRIPSETIQRLYDMCQYHLKISSTKWSVPTGIYDTHWNGLYFGFDEFFIFMGLATSGHLSTAKKIPHFRFNTLEKAKSRLNSSNRITGAARYAWESDEDGLEGSPAGFWHEHLFQAGNYTLEAWSAYLFTGDRDLLERELYPVMRAMAEWIRIFKIIRAEDGSNIVGPCTDLERLGPGRVNPFMTACSLIAMFEAASEAAGILNCDSDRIPLWRNIASDLRKNLPRRDGRYVPCGESSEQSIAALAGLYPYGVLSPDDPLQRSALEDYSKARFRCGNMYSFVKTGVCSWYACWEALAYARAGDGDRALKCLEELAENTGCFSEMYEIYNAGLRPWFTTAEGTFLHAVNELFIQFRNGEPVVAPARPEGWNDFSFRLQGRNGMKIEAEYQNGKQI